MFIFFSLEYGASIKRLKKFCKKIKNIYKRLELVSYIKYV